MRFCRMLSSSLPSSRVEAGTERDDTLRKLEMHLPKSFRTNAISNIHLFKLYMLLILKGNAKNDYVYTPAHWHG